MLTAATTTTVLTSHQRPPPSQQLLQQIIIEFGINFQDDNQLKIPKPSDFKGISLCWLCSCSEESGKIPYHAQSQLSSKISEIVATSKVNCKVYLLLLIYHYVLTTEVYAWERVVTIMGGDSYHYAYLRYAEDTYIYNHQLSQIQLGIPWLL